MEFLRNYLQQIRQMIDGLSRSAKLAVGLLVVLMVVALVMLVRYGGKSELEPVFQASLPPDQLAQAQAVLRPEMTVEVKDGQLLVPADKKELAYSLLAYQNLMPADSVSEFERLLNDGDMWRTADETQHLRKQAKEFTLSRLIGGFPDVKRATVLIEEGEGRKFGKPGSDPTATVHLTLKPSTSIGRKLIAAIADTVVGAVRGMAREQVRIVDATNGRSFRVEEDDDLAAGQIERLREIEKYYHDKLSEALNYINGAIVSVHAEPDPVRSRHTEEETYDPDGTVSEVVSSVSETSTGGPTGPGGEPGVVPNAAARPVESGASGAGTEKTDRTIDARFSRSIIRIDSRGRVTEEVTASVNVPRSYVIRLWRSINGQESDPSEPEFTGAFDQLGQQVRDQVAKAIGATDAAAVSVGWYLDAEIAPPQVVAQAGIGPMFTRYGKPFALSGLALVALVMVMMLVRRRNPAPSAVEVSNPLEALTQDPIGSAGGETSALPGLELDEETIRTQRVVDQVGQMVTSNPESAANLVRRWLAKK